jgi:hypothetical protein
MFGKIAGTAVLGLRGQRCRMRAWREKPKSVGAAKEFEFSVG